MIKNIFCLIVFILIFVSCKSNQTINGLKQGLWIKTYKIDSVTYKSKGRFKNNDEIGKWQFFENGIRVKKEIYKKTQSIKTFYHQNGKIASTGRTKTNVTAKMLHWFYDGVWKFYDDRGQLIRIKIYENSALISDKEITKQ